nr:hypothetical protein [Tanacetum cinerariifolium]
MLNKDNYVSWSSRIIRYGRSRPNGKMIVDSIENGPYVKRMIATPRELDLPIPVPESFHEQTEEELTENGIKRMDKDDQAIQTILLGLPEDEKKAKLFNQWEKFTSTDGESIESYYHHFMTSSNPRTHQIAQLGMNISQDRQIQNVGGTGRNQFREYAGQVAQNQQGYNAWQNGLRVRERGIKPGATIAEDWEEARIQLQAEEFDFMAAAGDLDKIEEVNSNCILMSNL